MSYEKPISSGEKPEGMPEGEEAFGQIVAAALEPFAMQNRDLLKKRLMKFHPLCAMLSAAVEAMRMHGLASMPDVVGHPVWRQPFLAPGTGEAELVIVCKAKPGQDTEDARTAHENMVREWLEGPMKTSTSSLHKVRFIPLEKARVLGTALASGEKGDVVVVRPEGAPHDGAESLLAGVHPAIQSYALMIDKEMRDEGWTPETDVSDPLSLAGVVAQRADRLRTNVELARKAPDAPVSEVARDAVTLGRFALRTMLRIAAEKGKVSG